MTSFKVPHIFLCFLMIIVVGFSGTGLGQGSTPSDVHNYIQVATSNERSTLDRRTMKITSTADVTLTNISSQTLAVPFHGVIEILNATGTVTMPYASGGPGTVPYGKYYYNLFSGGLADGLLAPGEAVTFTVRFVRSSTVTFRYNVIPYGILQEANHPPIANAGPDQTRYVTETAILNGSGSSDVDGDLLSFNWSFLSRPGGSTAALLNPLTVNPSFIIDRPGSYTIQLMVNDGKVDSAPDTVVISTLNSAPVAKAGPDQTVHAGEPVTLDGSGSSDVDGNPLTYAWSFVSRPAGSTAVLHGANTATPYFTSDEVGDYVIQLIVNDGLVNSASDSVTISTYNSRPVANAGPDQNVQVNTTVNLSGGASSDADGDPLSYAWSFTSVPSGSATTLTNANTVTPSFVTDRTGTYVVQLIVNDGWISSNPDTLVIIVANDPPVANAGPDREGLVGTSTNFNGSGSYDPNGDPLTYAWSVTSAPAGSTATIFNPTSVTPGFTPDRPGTYVIQLIVHDGTSSSAPDSLTLTVRVLVPNVVGMTQASATSTLAAAGLTTGAITQAYSSIIPLGSVISQNPAEGTAVSAGTAVSLVISLGPQTVVVPNVMGMTQSDAQSTITAAGLTLGTVTAVSSSTVPAGSVISQDPAAGTTVAHSSAVNLVVSSGPAQVTIPNVVGLTQSSATSTISNVGLVVGTVTYETSATVPSGSVISQSPAGGISVLVGSLVNLVISTGTSNIPPDPSAIAPPVDPSVATTMSKATEFLYTGSNPIQTGVVSGTIEAKRVAVIRGKVMTRDGNPLPGVTITILNHPEYGQTLSRSDGMFDMAVNGGGYLTVDYQKEGYLPAQRQVNAPWQGFAQCPNVALVPLDNQVTELFFPVWNQQIARGSQVMDGDGSRRLTMLVPENTSAELVFADGSTQPVNSLHVRFTEYTIGPNGPVAMPAELPPTSAYTYAVELSADEAIAAGADHVQFSQSAFLYLENFVNIPVGKHVPVGFYDRQKGAWVASRDGRVLRIVNIPPEGLPQLDVDGDGDSDEYDENLRWDLEIGDEELTFLASTYSTGQALWRVPITHFSPPDLNYGAAPGAGAKAPSQGISSQSDPKLEKPASEGGFGSLDIENQVFRESLQIAGTPFSLNYASDRAPGRQKAYELDIPLSGETLPPGVKEIKLEIWIAGRQFTYSFGAVQNQSYRFIWDGRDAYQRALRGAHKASIRIGYVYDAVYQEPPQMEQTFALLSGVPISTSPARSEWTLWQEHEVTFNLPATWFAMGQGVGGWTLGAHHAYDVNGGILHLGTGRDRTWQSGTSPERIILPAVGNGQQGYQGDEVPALETSLNEPIALKVAPNGLLLIADTHNHRIRMVDQAGIIHTVAGTGVSGYNGDNIPATEAMLSMPSDIALRGENELYIADYFNGHIRKVVGWNSPQSTITTVAGNGLGAGDDGVPATDTRLNYPWNIGVAPDGTLYISEYYGFRVRRVGTDGIITTLAGTGESGFEGDGGPAVQAKITNPGGIAVDPDGAVYFSDVSNQRIRRVGTDGRITTVAGNGNAGYSGDGGPATEASLSYPSNLAITPDGTLYIADSDGKRIRKVDIQGIITTVAGTGERGDTGDGGPATQAMVDIPYGLAVAPDGTVFLTSGNRVRKVLPANPVRPEQEFLIPSEDGGVIYRFNAEGRHLSTLHGLTGATLLTFNYDGNGRLFRAVDAYGKITLIERDANGRPTGIVGPYGQQTSLSVNSDGYLSAITNPASQTITLVYNNGGLLQSVTDPKNGTYQFPYEASGLVDGGADPAGGSTAFSRGTTPSDTYIRTTSAEGRTSWYTVENLDLGGQRRRIIRPDGTQVQIVKGVQGDQKREGATSVQMPTGTTLFEQTTGDPRFGLQSPILQDRQVTVPYQGGSLISSVSGQRNVVLADPQNPLSLQSLTDTLTINGRTFSQSYNADTRNFTSTTPLGRQRTWRIDANGRLIESQVPGLGTAGYAYDPQGRLVSITRSSGTETRTSTFAYNPNGFLASATDPLSRVLSYQYDPVGRVTTFTGPDLRETHYTYDINGNLSQLTPPGRPAHQFGYNAVDNPNAYIAPAVDALPRETRQVYNRDRQTTQLVRPDGQTLDMTYDNAGRLSAVQVSPGSEQITYAYNNTTGLQTQISGPDGVSQQFDYYGSLPAGTTWTGAISGSVTRSYDQDFRVTRLDVQNAPYPILLRYDNDSLLTGVGYDQTNGMMTLVRNPQNGLITATNLGPVVDARGYNGFGELSDYAATCNGSACFNVLYTRDALGRITEKTETVGGTTRIFRYFYDQTGRLTEVRDGSNNLISAYAYDENGNRLSYSGPFGNTTGIYDNQDRLSSYGGNTYEYTANGDLLRKVSGGQTTTYAYDAFGNLKSVTLPGGSVVSYLVDGSNHRVAKRINGTVVKGFLYGGGFSPIAELDGSNNIVSLFMYGTRSHVPDLILKNNGTGTFIPYRIISNHLGSPRLVVNVLNGTEIAQQLDYDEFGRVLSDTNPGFQPFGFAGGLYDPETGLTRFGFRDYDPMTGRWTAKDPVGFGGGDTNLYAYNGNEPVNLIDPSGLGPSGFGVNPSSPSGIGLGSGFGLYGSMNDLPTKVEQSTAIINGGGATGMSNSGGYVTWELIQEWAKAQGRPVGDVLADFYPNTKVSEGGKDATKVGEGKDDSDGGGSKQDPTELIPYNPGKNIREWIRHMRGDYDNKMLDNALLFGTTLAMGYYVMYQTGALPPPFNAAPSPRR